MTEDVKRQAARIAQMESGLVKLAAWDVTGSCIDILRGNEPKAWKIFAVLFGCWAVFFGVHILIWVL